MRSISSFVMRSSSSFVESSTTGRSKGRFLFLVAYMLNEEIDTVE